MVVTTQSACNAGTQIYNHVLSGNQRRGMEASGRMAQDVIRAINDPYVNSLGVNDTPD